MTGGGRYQNGLKQMKNNAALLQRIEQKFGVPIPVVVSFWGLESDYGAYKGGTFQIIRAVATLAYDCRRPAFFRAQLMDAVRLVARGDLRPDEMIGNWAGELGPTQFTPSDYFKSGVDFDGDGKVDMIRARPMRSPPPPI
jgi:membrane-bound lytic murein transglycosylase B